MNKVKNTIISFLSVLMVSNLAQAQQGSSKVHSFVSDQVVALDSGFTESQCRSMFAAPLIPSEVAQLKVLLKEVPANNFENGVINAVSCPSKVLVHEKTEKIASYFIGFVKKGTSGNTIVRINKYCLATGIIEKN